MSPRWSTERRARRRRSTHLSAVAHCASPGAILWPGTICEKPSSANTRAMMAAVRRLLNARAAMLASLAIMCLNYAGTSRWSHIPGALHGARQPIFVGILAVTIVLGLLRWPAHRAPLGRVASASAGAAIVVLIILFFVWFPLE